MTLQEKDEITTDAVRAVCSELFASSGSEHSACFALEDQSILHLQSYLAQLMKWNAVMNLVGPYSWRDVLSLLIADSFYLADFLTTLPYAATPQCWDLGSGAGLPGIPLRMVWQQGEYTLVEAREKRALFLQTVLSSCKLPNVHVFRGRAEIFMPQQPMADLIVSRAFLPWQKVLDLVAPFVRQQGLCVFLTLTPPPETVPPLWQITHHKEYRIRDDVRYFWAFVRH